MQWKNEILVRNFTIAGIEAIKNGTVRPDPSSLMKDRLIWQGTSSGKYSVKMGYNLLNDQGRPNHKTGTLLATHLGHKCDAKSKHFLWKVGQGALPVMAVLSRRLHSMSPTCQVCGNENETVHHMIFACAHARATWFASPFHIRTDELVLDAKAALFAMLSGLNENDRKLASYLTWEIWKGRNTFIFENKPADPQATLYQAIQIA
jgi:zinc-binding in reverse transcriptase